MDILSNIQHPNVIFLLGYSAHDDTRFIVYELMHNGSLETHLHGTALIFPPRPLSNLNIGIVSLSLLKLCCIYIRSFSWIGINLAYEDENCSGYSKVSLFLHKILLLTWYQVC